MAPPRWPTLGQQTLWNVVEAAVSCWQKHTVSLVLLPFASLCCIGACALTLMLAWGEGLSTPIFQPQSLSALPCQ